MNHRGSPGKIAPYPLSPCCTRRRAPPLRPAGSPQGASVPWLLSPSELRRARRGPDLRPRGTKKSTPAKDPDSYVEAPGGWQRDRVAAKREAVRSVLSLEEGIKWGHLAYTREGPMLYVRVEAQRVLFGFWRGQQLDSFEPMLKATGRYEMATMEIREDTKISRSVVPRLAKEAAALNLRLGDPRLEAKRPAEPKRGR
ncbi:MAG: DUF1801 domain-containing protein [Holophagales bacterium]|nr:DUF1801 domain-containing protein [Holophagales bacterium]